MINLHIYVTCSNKLTIQLSQTIMIGPYRKTKEVLISTQKIFVK